MRGVEFGELQRQASGQTCPGGDGHDAGDFENVIIVVTIIVVEAVGVASVGLVSSRRSID